MLCWVGIDQPMKMRETSRATDKKPQVNNKQVCDSDYRGEYIVALHNDSNMSRLINPGERIAQLVVLPYVPIEFKEADKLSDTDRGFGGFGSTGKQVRHMPPRKKKEQPKKNNNYKYQTIASTDTNYSTFEVMKEYDDLDTARNSYFNDMKEWKNDENHKEYLHFGIREVKLNK